MCDSTDFSAKASRLSAVDDVWLKLVWNLVIVSVKPSSFSRSPWSILLRLIERERPNKPRPINMTDPVICHKTVYIDPLRIEFLGRSHPVSRDHCPFLIISNAALDRFWSCQKIRSLFRCSKVRADGWISTLPIGLHSFRSLTRVSFIWM